MSVRIVTDSTCDLPSEIIARYGIYVVPLYINVGNQGFLDGVDMTREEFYKKLPTFPIYPTTAVPSLQKFHAVYDALAEQGATHILSIHISMSLSGVVDVARVAARETKSVAVTVFDSRQLSLGSGFMVETAARMAEAGNSIEEIINALNEQIKRSHVFAALDTLDFLNRSGRMSRFMANFGALLKIKPIMTMYDGKPGSERVRTRGNATKRLIEMLEQIGPFERVAILHTNAPERVAELRSLTKRIWLENDLLVANLTPVIGVHIGPGAYGFAAIRFQHGME